MKELHIAHILELNRIPNPMNVQIRHFSNKPYGAHRMNLVMLNSSDSFFGFDCLTGSKRARCRLLFSPARAQNPHLEAL